MNRLTIKTARIAIYVLLAAAFASATREFTGTFKGI